MADESRKGKMLNRKKSKTGGNLHFKMKHN